MKIELDATGMAAIATATAAIVTAVCHASEVNRETMSQASRDDHDRIQAQAYWDWRAVLQFIGIVGEPMKGTLNAQ